MKKPKPTPFQQTLERAVGVMLPDGISFQALFEEKPQIEPKSKPPKCARCEYSYGRCVKCGEEAML